MNDWAQYKGVSGIYAIENVTNGKVYVGQAQDIRKRWMDHRRDLRRGNHANVHLQRSWAKHGEMAFVFVILEVSEPGALDGLEQFHMDARNAAVAGFNINPVARTRRGAKLSDADKAKQREAQNRPDVRLKRSTSLKLYWKLVDSSIGQARRDAFRRMSVDPAVRKVLTQKAKEVGALPHIRAARSEGFLRRWSNPEFRARMLRGMQAWRDSPESRIRLSEGIARSWADQGTRERRTAALKAAHNRPEVLAAKSKRGRAASRLTENLVQEIRDSYVKQSQLSGAPALAKKYGISKSMVSNIILRKNWV